METRLNCPSEALRVVDLERQAGETIIISPEKAYLSGLGRQFFEKVDLALFFTARLQNILNKLLNNYLNGEDIIPSRLNYFTSMFLNCQVNQNLLTECLSCINILRSLEIIEYNDALEATASMLSHNKDYNTHMPIFLSKAYESLDAILNHLGTNTHTDVLATERSFKAAQYEGLVGMALGKLAEHYSLHLNTNFSYLYLLGSLSSLDFVPGLSDLDTLLLIKRDTLLDFKRLKEARTAVLSSLPYFFWIDPLQHHGHITISEIDLCWYPQPFFPLTLLEECICLDGSTIPIRYTVRDSRFERLRTGFVAASSFYRGNETMKGWKDPYQIKFHLQVAQLLPVLLNQMTGNYAWKPKAFRRIKPQFSKEGWELVERSTQMRLSGGFDPIRCKTVYRRIVVGKNPRALQRRARRLGRVSTYLSLVKHYMGKPEQIKRKARNLAEESLAWVREASQRWSWD